MLIIALDPSSTACGWAVFFDGQLVAHGTTRRRTQPLYDYARKVAGEIRDCTRAYPNSELVEVYYEINDGKPVPRKAQKSIRKMQQATGRILQALGVTGIPIQADRRPKSKRAAETSLIYGIPTSPKQTYEHVLDAVALGHRVVTNPPKREGPRVR